MDFAPVSRGIKKNEQTHQRTYADSLAHTNRLYRRKNNEDGEKEEKKDPNCYNYDHPLKECKNIVLQQQLRDVKYGFCKNFSGGGRKKKLVIKEFCGF